MEIAVKRAYESPADDDGYRILVDRLWPRGISKENAHLDLWHKDVAPSNELRKWFGHDPAKRDEFVRRYREELDRNPEAFARLLQLAREHDKITLVYAAKDTQYNQALTLRDFLLAAGGA